jgi:hypothetical protein
MSLRDLPGLVLRELAPVRFFAKEEGSIVSEHMLVVGRAGEERVPVVHCGQRVGSLPAGWHPSHNRRSRSFLYDPRPGDFKWDEEAGAWVADRMLGPGDLDLVAGFVRSCE